MPRYEIHTLDMWGHVGADCVEHGCPCVTLHDTEEDSLGESAAIEARKATASHDENACQCSEDCNQQFRRGTLTVPKDATDAALLAALVEEGFTFPPGTEVRDYSDGPLDIDDADGRRLLHLIPIEPMRFRVPTIWQRTSRYSEAVRCHVLTHKGREGMLERFGDGGYPLFYQVKGEWSPGNRVEEYVCPECASNVHDAGNWPDNAQVTACDVNWENPDMFCDCGERIPSAYAECDDCDNHPKVSLDDGQYYEACSDPECPDDHLATCVTCKGGGGKLTDERKEEHDAWIAQGQAWIRRHSH